LITETPQPTATVQPTATALPEQVRLNSPAYELQDINNCGPATLAIYLRYFGWQGDQFTVSDVIKPIRQDRNVNIEELDYFIKNYAGWLNTIYRVGGDVDLLKQLIAGGFPVMIEETFEFDENFWPNDDRWAGHYLLVNGYDEQKQAFLTQDSYQGADLWVSYEELDRNWQSFNRVYTIIYLPEQEEKLKSILGENWDRDLNRQHALEVAEQETQNDPQNTFSWFNLGSNLVYFEEYDKAALAYDKAREIGWPQRMLRYQFGPFLAYFHTLRSEDLMTMVKYALERTPNSEEALLWQGWGLYRAGNKAAAIESFQKALEARPDYGDAIYALNYVSEN
jgi:tetratricopeptide (TPR) repeat protein